MKTSKRINEIGDIPVKKPMSGKIKKSLLKEKRELKKKKIVLSLEEEKNPRQNQNIKKDLYTQNEISVDSILNDQLLTIFNKETNEDVMRRKIESRIPYIKKPLGDLGFALHDDILPLPFQSISVKSNRNNQYTNIEIPIRPRWTSNTTKNELDKNEKEYFKNYLKDIYENHEKSRLNQFEHNIEV